MTETQDLHFAPVANVEAERAVLGALLVAPDSASEVFTLLDPSEFSGRHIDLAMTLKAMVNAGRPVDAVSVLAELRSNGQLDKVGGGPYLHTLSQWAAPQAVLYHAGLVSQATVRRRLQAMGLRALQIAGSDAIESGLRTEMALLAAEVEQLLDAAGSGQGPPVPPLPWEDFMLGDDAYDWLIPGLLERGDRLMLTGGEGDGKSVMIRQLCISVAAGLHPITYAPMEPQPVLLVDCENGRKHLKRELKRVVTVTEHYGRPVPSGMFRIICRPEGLDLTRPDDAAWLLEQAMAAGPALIAIGPLYRLHAQNMNDEQPARQLTAMLDLLRARLRCTIVVETHSPHPEPGRARAMRPIGSSLFQRWPEFGYGLVKVKGNDHLAHFRHWRGARDERLWPAMFRRGNFGVEWPWVEHIEEGENSWTR